MAESATHRERVAAMVAWMQRQGVTITHASGGLALPDPYRIGRHEPDAIGMKNGVIWIGEAKVGNDLSASTSREQFEDFGTCSMTDTGALCPFILCVPKGYATTAEEAVRSAGGRQERLTMIA